MNKPISFLIFLILFLGSIHLSLRATQPASWTVSTQGEFVRGDLKGVSLTSDGTLVLAPDFQQVLDTEESLIYAAITDRSGTVYLGTGDNGKIFQVTPSGQGREWADLEESGVYTLAVDSQNRLYAGTSPNGRIYRFDDQGQPEILFDPQEKYIWSLAVDFQNNLFAGTGPKGIIYKVTPSGEGSIYYDSKETHIVSLKWDLDRNLLAGGAPGALVFRISPTGEPFVLYDSPLEEIKAIEVDRYGNTYVAALAGTKSSGKTSSAAKTSRSRPAKNNPKKTAGESTVQIAAATTQTKQLEIYKIDKENLVETLYASGDELAFDLLIRSDGHLLVATGNKGRILSIDPHKFVTFLVQSSEEQVTQLLEQEGKIYAATSNLAKLFQLLPQPSTQGIYKSSVLDAKMPASWGRIRWHVKNPVKPGIKVSTRSGNTEIPDPTWSAWNGPYQDPKGNSINSPTARYLQWKIEFPEKGRTATVISRSNALDSLTVTYIQKNMAPRLISLTVHPQGIAFAQYPASPPPAGASLGGPGDSHLRSLPRSIRELDKPTIRPPRRKLHIPGTRSISWIGEDPNQDDLVYSIYYRSQEEDSWKLLQEKQTKAYYTMDGVSFPDDTYLVRVVVSDKVSNPPNQALQSELISKPFVIANSSPAIQFAAAQVDQSKANLSFTARTLASNVYQTEYSVNGGEWTLIFPRDGIADGGEEEYSLSLNDLKPGENVISVRVVDSVGNIGTGKTMVRVR